MTIWAALLVLSLHFMSSLGQEGPGPQKWRLCYVCKGRFPDRECELYPKYVTRGPGRTNCTKSFCTSYVKYTPKRYLMRLSEDGDTPTTSRPLTPADYEVTSIVRECEDFPRKKACSVEGDKMSATCYSTCVTDFCNGETPRPSWDDFKRARDPNEDHVPFPDVFDDEEEEKRGRRPPRGQFGRFPPPPPGYRPRDRDGEEEEGNEIDERRRPPPFGGPFPPFAGLLRPGEMPDKEQPRGPEKGDRARPHGGRYDEEGTRRPAPPTRSTKRSGSDDTQNRIRDDRPEKDDSMKRRPAGENKRKDEEKDSGPAKEEDASKASTSGAKPKPTTPTTKPRRGNGRVRVRGSNAQGKLSEAGETSKSQGDKSASSAPTVSMLSSAACVIILNVLYLFKAHALVGGVLLH